jgi:hypothetical protein
MSMDEESFFFFELPENKHKDALKFMEDQFYYIPISATAIDGGMVLSSTFADYLTTVGCGCCESMVCRCREVMGGDVGAVDYFGLLLSLRCWLWWLVV